MEHEYGLFFFFFSSRRRHTRLTCDWSSDVCSSDLAWLAYGLQDVVLQRRLIDGSEGDLAHRRRLAAHLDAMLALCETAECRRTQLLGYFGEVTSPCGNCDTCLSPPESWDGTIAAQKLLSAVFRLQRERRQR